MNKIDIFSLNPIQKKEFDSFMNNLKIPYVFTNRDKDGNFIIDTCKCYKCGYNHLDLYCIFFLTFKYQVIKLCENCYKELNKILN